MNEIHHEDVDAKRLGCLQVLDAEQLHRAADPYEMILYTQRLAEQEVLAYAREHGLEILTSRVTWECRVEAIAQ